MKNRYGLILMMMTLFACTKPYNPPAITDKVSYLVVEGTINPGSDSTVINLSHTVSLATPITDAPELNATVTVESNQNNTYPLISTGKGRYVSAPLNANSINQYRLRILRSNGETYLSDFVQVKNSPAIDSVSYTLQNNAVQINTATHDPTGNSRYYRWDYTETYPFHSAFNSPLMVVHTPKDTIVARPLADQIYMCYLTDTGKTIVLNSSAKLTQDLISKQQLISIPVNSEKFEDLYSIEVNQYALTSDAFNYYQQLLTNSQQLGSIFAAQPTVLTGNIHCVSTPTEYVLGYISAGTIAHQRIFISAANLPAVTYVTPYSGCALDKALYDDPLNDDINEVIEWLYSDLDIPIAVIPGKGYTIGYPFCTDCRIRGTVTKPSFWP